MQPLTQCRPIHGPYVKLRALVEHHEAMQRLVQCRHEVITIQIVARQVQADHFNLLLAALQSTRPTA